LAILRAFAETLDHGAARVLERPFVHYVQNQPNKAREHFYGLREAKTDLVGIAVFDRIQQGLRESRDLRERMWSRREIENYLCQPETLLAYAETSPLEATIGALFDEAEVRLRRDAMEASIKDLVPPVALRARDDPWWTNVRASEEFLDRLFDAYFDRLELPNLMRKTDYHVLAKYVPRELLAPEVSQLLDEIVEVAGQANPAEDEVNG
jgi:hypothetical protein